ncbi:hypothetical protein AAEK16_001905 [Enterobacter roggenkampii]
MTQRENKPFYFNGLVLKAYNLKIEFLKSTEILFNLFSFGFPQSRQHWRGLAVWFEEK